MNPAVSKAGTPGGMQKRGEVWFRIAQLAVPLLLVPAFIWARTIDADVRDVRADQRAATKERTTLEGFNKELRAEIQSVQSSIDRLKTELVQRLTRVETKLDK